VGDGPFERTDHIAQTKYQAALAAIEILRRLARIREARAHGASLGRAGQREVLERHAYQLGRMWVEFLASMTAPPKKQPTKKVRARARKEVMG
jgi:hypothetical protein